MRLYLPDPAATAELASRLHAVLPADTAGWTLLLEGELGAGKSTIARALIAAMGHSGKVPSPTYTLVEPYELPRGMVYHIDLYRVTSEQELRYLGWNELEDGFRLVEWPDRAPALAASADLLIRLEYAPSGRNAEITGLSTRGAELVAQMSATTMT
ncbi:MAG: tRNA (adenosine(37)-N6)-threonylcarbamoyltransferase complex ATPase subunit type 1 TsaE [Gammaproteobacteria bacterium]|nr:tRNA (adenosine(37)-N6)-threonylcarbamoyltransferase complex ATPase subunit type 1 TsaE [Gammaproteobacteria bacterium]MDH3407927.1 tRNA (adenosine(37)-N6)-threonylcarbamoyltransferase complex ATPase subunit type 1 TsaE [Gammaproteobacteria bacterium]MDH3551477.1 tRNA (adenosine(37)-N6)-threonylcarbamoyltransferase complex ATPase subunit type 1 TsaE [Gammaproteobacteria bacterium]